MKLTMHPRLAAILTVALATPLLAAAETPVRYVLKDLGAVGASPGQPFQITNAGLISGVIVGNGAAHATVWYRRIKTAIDSHGLGGSNSIAFGANDWFQVVGEAETSTPDPNHEDFCGFRASGLSASGTCLPYEWDGSRLIALPTLGGPNGAANQINNSGEVVGTAEGSMADGSCPTPQVLQFKPVVWRNGRVHELPTVAGDPDGIAFALNQSGQVVGGSGLCSAFTITTLTNLFPLHALLWEKGKAIDLGSLGGTGNGGGNVALNINNLGQIVGNSDLPGDATNHAFLWTRGKGMRDLGTLAGDPLSAALSINDSGKIVGISLDASFNPRAFVWQNGVMTDMNTLIPDSSTLYLLIACSINADGQIVGFGVDTITGEVHGYLATPKMN